MKILFIIPSQYNVYGQDMPAIYPPIGALSLAAALRNVGHDIHVIDMDVDIVSTEEMLKAVENYSPTLFALHVQHQLSMLRLISARQLKRSTLEC